MSEYQIRTLLRVDLPTTLAKIPLPGPRCAAELGEVIHRKPIDFDTGSAVISKESRPVLDDLTKVLQRCTKDLIEIGGHTDSQGSEDLNQRISQARAESVLGALIDRGISIDRIRAKGYGEVEPIADNATEEGRARNRRIEFKTAPEEED